VSGGRGRGKAADPGPASGDVRAHAIISGIVQGVCFRAETRHVAQTLGVGGWVRNRDDGSVELMAEGSREIVESLLEWCRRGPPHARVDSVDVTWETPGGEFIGFGISR